MEKRKNKRGGGKAKYIHLFAFKGDRQIKEHLCNVRNVSQYIRSLIEKDLVRTV